MSGSKRRVQHRVNTVTGCWEFLGHRMKNGYGQMWDGTKVTSAHRAYFTLAGRAIPDGYALDHLCRNPICVNPDHMEAVSYGENARRGNGGKLTAPQVRAMRQLYATGSTTYRRLAKLFGCSPMHVSNIINGHKNRDAGGPFKVSA